MTSSPRPKRPPAARRARQHCIYTAQRDGPFGPVRAWRGTALFGRAEVLQCSRVSVPPHSAWWAEGRRCGQTDLRHPRTLWRMPPGTDRRIAARRAPSSDRRRHAPRRRFARGFGRDLRALPQLVAAARQVGGLGGVARQLDGLVVRDATRDCGRAGAAGRRGSHGRRDKRPACPPGGRRPHLPWFGAPLVGGLSPLLRTPPPRSDTASRMSFKPFWHAGCERSGGVGNNVALLLMLPRPRTDGPRRANCWRLSGSSSPARSCRPELGAIPPEAVLADHVAAKLAVANPRCIDPVPPS
jgi:hypothetical protein